MKKRIKFDDGSIAQIEVPEGATKEQINAFVTNNMAAIQAKARPQLKQRETYDMSDPDRGSALNSLLRGATFDFADEAMGGIAATYAKMHDMVTGKDSGITYADAVESVRQDQEAFAERNPGVDMALQVAGGLATGGIGGAKVLGSQTLKQAPKFIQAAAVPAVAGAEGAMYGLGSGEGMEDRLQQAGQQGLVSAVAGPLLQKFGQKVGNKLFAKEAKDLQQKLTPDKTLSSIKGEAREFYNKAEAAGVVIKGDKFKGFRDALLNDLGSEAIDGQTYPKIAKAIRRLEKTETPTYKDVEAIKKLLKQARASANPDDRRVGGMINSSIDDFINSLKPDDVAAGSISDLTDHLKKAKNLWSRKAQTEILDEVEDKAYRSEAFIKQGDLDQAFRSKIRPIVENPRRKLGLEEEVVTSLDDMIQGGPMKNLMRNLAAVGPGSHTQRGLLAATGAAGIGMATVGPAGLLLGVVPGLTGLTAQKIANKMTKSEIDKIRNAVLNKGQLETDQIVSAIMEKYQPMIAGGAASIAGSTADQPVTTLQDMMQ